MHGSEGLESVQVLTRLYRASRLHSTSFKLRTKTCIGVRVVNKYDPPLPPAHSVLSHGAVDVEVKTALQQLLSAVDPVALFAEIRAAQFELGRRGRL